MRRPIIAVIVVSLLSVGQASCVEVRPPPGTPASTDLQALVEAQPARREASDAERKLYAEREQQATALKKFRGGDAGVVTVLVVVLLVVLLLVLLKVI